MAQFGPGFVRALVIGLLASCAAPVWAAAQAARDARVVISVVDPTGGLIPGATVTLVGLDAATKAVAPAPIKTTAGGVATFETVTPGRYSIQAEFSGFNLGLIRDVRIARGDNKRLVMLPFKNLQESVNVGGGQDGASTRGSSAFGLALTADQIEALSDDATELQRQIAELGGPDAIIRVDSFEGGQLPPKAQIKSIHVTRDQFAAETEQPGSTFVDVITQAGTGPIRGGANVSFHDGRMNGPNPFLTAGTRTPEQQSSYGFNIAGALIQDRADFSLSINGQNRYANPILNASTVTGQPARVLEVDQGLDATSVNGLFNYAISKNQTLRATYSQYHYVYRNESVGGYTDEQGATGSEYTDRTLRVQEAGPIGRRMFLNTRMSLGGNDEKYSAAHEGQTFIVLDDMTKGGGQSRGGTHSRNFNIASDLDYVRGIHSWRVGLLAYGGSYRTNYETDYLGTYTYSSPAAFAAGQASLFTISTGTPSFSYFNAQGGVYVQDDIRVRKSLTLSSGVRYSAQTRIHDPGAFEPRFGVTWAPLKSGKTTLRASAGTFHNWLGTSVLSQTIRLDGTHQRQLIINGPTFPIDVNNLSKSALVPPTKYQIGSWQLQQNLRYSAGIDQVLSPRLRVSALYNYIHVTQMPRGKNLNPLVNGARQDPAFASVIETVTDGELRRHEFSSTFSLNLAPPGPATAASRFNWRRATVTGTYATIQVQRNTVGPFEVPPSGTLDTEWGPGPADSRYRLTMSFNSTQVRNLSVSLTASLADGFVYSESTGTDDNRDGFFNDRPAGVGRASLRAPGQETVNTRISYAFVSGTPVAGTPPRYRANVYISIQNLTNHANLTGFSGVVTSPNFMRATGIANARRIDMGMSVNF